MLGVIGSEFYELISAYPTRKRRAILCELLVRGLSPASDDTLVYLESLYATQRRSRIVPTMACIPTGRCEDAEEIVASAPSAAVWSALGH